MRFEYRNQANAPAPTRLEFSRAVLQRGMGFAPIDLNCLFKLSGPRDIYDVSFKTAQTLQDFWNKYRLTGQQAPLDNYIVETLTDTEVKVVTVIFYNEAVSDFDITLWLNLRCKIESVVRRVTDEDGVWTGARKWLVRLHPDDTGIGGVRHLPSTITLGQNRWPFSITTCLSFAGTVGSWVT